MPLTSLFVRDFAIVRQLELEFTPGLTVLTGETGAGKSILVDALALALGARADAGSIRSGAPSAEAMASFRVDPDDDAAAWLREQELTDDGACMTRRVVFDDKPSRAYVNGRPVTVQMLKELGARLVDIHGQHEHQSLLRRDVQRGVLDAYAAAENHLQRVARLYDEIQLLRADRGTLSREAAERSSRLETLRYQISELESLDLAQGEYAELESEHRRLAHASELIEGMHFANGLLHEGQEDTVDLRLSQCIQRLDALTAFAPDIADVKSLLDEALVQVQEAGLALNQKLAGAELDPARLQWVEQRMRAILDVARKHHCEPAALPTQLQALSEELSTLENADANLTALDGRIAAAEDEYRRQAEDLSSLRREAGIRLADEVTHQMQALGMAGALFEVRIDPVPEDFTRFGRDRIEYRVTANPGQPLRPLSKVASGGELSRMSLAIQVVTSTLGRVPTLVFDEVDVGIGGGVAEVVGRKLRDLGKDRQVLCVTHLAQVAAQGGTHLQIGKEQDGGVSVAIRPLAGAEREDEVARMLGGIEITEKTREHARDMLARASL